MKTIIIPEQIIPQDPIVIPAKELVVESLNINFSNQTAILQLTENGEVVQSQKLDYADVISKLNSVGLGDKDISDVAIIAAADLDATVKESVII